MPEQFRNLVVTATNNETSDTILDRRVAVIDTTSEGGIKLPSGANSVETAYGITLMDIAAGEVGALAIDGIAYITAAAVITLGAIVVIANSVGKIKAKAAGATAVGLSVIGVALRAAGADGDVIPVRLLLTNEYGS